jgi:hypothetical protein
LTDAVAQLREQGVIVVRNVFPKPALSHLRKSAEACFDALGKATTAAAGKRYHFTPFSHSVVLDALLDFGVDSHEELIAPCLAASVEGLIAAMKLGNYALDLRQAWVRKRYAPSTAPRHYHPNSWHQDGGLGVAFDTDPNSKPPMTRLVTCWIPLQACHGDCPSLEFVRRRLDALLHYTDLNDIRLREIFSDEPFWMPDLDFGDGVVFLAGTLHRTYSRPEMRQDRLSLEYRFFPTGLEKSDLQIS